MSKKIIGTACMSIGAVCFGLVAYGNFYRGNIIAGTLFALSAVLNIISAILFSTKGKNRE